jgi:hypothetical protein
MKIVAFRKKRGPVPASHFRSFWRYALLPRLGFCGQQTKRTVAAKVGSLMSIFRRRIERGDSERLIVAG